MWAIIYSLQDDNFISAHPILKLHTTFFSVLESIMTFSIPCIVPCTIPCTIPCIVQGIVAIFLVFTSVRECCQRCILCCWFLIDYLELKLFQSSDSYPGCTLGCPGELYKNTDAWFQP